MSELIAIGFKDLYRASEVLNEWQRREWGWVAELDRAIVVRLYEEDKYRVHFIIDPTSRVGGTWARLWVSFLSLALQVPFNKEIFCGFGDVSAPSMGGSGSGSPLPDIKWWTEVLGVSGEFVRDVGALIRPGDSAIFMILQAPNTRAAFLKMRNYGGTVLRTTFSAEQDRRLIDALN
jgi:uncharacterized membrane protein